MKQNLPVTQREKAFPSDLRLVSKTDLKGIITYANDHFVEMSGFSRDELIGKNHNLVRHPDMPPQAFEWLWDTLKAGRPWRGIVKNRCKNGDHYWVDALVVPVLGDGKTVGYVSVRRAPTRQQIAEAEKLYAELNRTHAAIVSRFERFRFKNLSLQTKLQIVIQTTLLVVLSLGNYWLSENFRSETLESARRHATDIANATIDGANMLMETNTISDIDNRKLLIRKIASAGQIKSLRLIRAKQVADQFGPGLPEEQIRDEVERQAIDSKTANFTLTRDENGDPEFRAVVPYIVSHNFHGTDCLLCHLVKEGSVNGASDIRIDLKSDFSRLHDMQWRLLAAQVFLQVFLFIFIGRSIKLFVRDPLQQAMGHFRQVMKADLTPPIDFTARDEMGDLFCAIQTTQSYVQVMLDEMETAATIIVDRSNHLDAQVIQVAEHTKEQQQHVQRIAGSMDGFTRSVSGVADAAGESAAAAGSSLGIVEDSNHRMEQSINSTTLVVQAVQSSSQTIGELKAAIHKIGDVTKVIKEIAEQTNLLALNAAIEAARAGDQGRGFAVVADEVRKLAERTSASTGDISAIVKNIHTVTEAAVASMDAAVTQVERGIGLIRENGEALKRIVVSSHQVADKSQEIAGASKEQYVASAEVAKSLENISALVDDNARAAEDARESSEKLARTAADLKQMVRNFEITSL